ncbi:hypothetical protein FALBO_11802 [Fusarium albosuccineum]|uniref:Uncharacterized protein n=1 Tax=Fusarium albosuccineum TaxID=1237068 RepID=A0A8H4P6V4_9HYPO|nr:hypothetical protein FALBO_11802 [Fusarium albosuccineum]
MPVEVHRQKKPALSFVLGRNATPRTVDVLNFEVDRFRSRACAGYQDVAPSSMDDLRVEPRNGRIHVAVKRSGVCWEKCRSAHSRTIFFPAKDLFPFFHLHLTSLSVPQYVVHLVTITLHIMARIRRLTRTGHSTRTTSTSVHERGLRLEKNRIKDYTGPKGRCENCSHPEIDCGHFRKPPLPSSNTKQSAIAKGLSTPSPVEDTIVCASIAVANVDVSRNGKDGWKRKEPFFRSVFPHEWKRRNTIPRGCGVSANNHLLQDQSVLREPPLRQEFAAWHSPQTGPLDAVPTGYNTGNSFGPMADSLLATGIVAAANHESQAHSYGLISSTDLENTISGFDWALGPGSGQQPRFVSFFAKAYAERRSPWLMIPEGELEALCGDYKLRFIAAEGGFEVPITNHEGLLQLPFIVALGVMTVFDAPLYEIRRQQAIRDTIDALQSWVARILKNSLPRSRIALFRIRAFLMAALYFQCQGENHAASKYLEAAKAISQQYILAGGGLDKMIKGNSQGRESDFIFINLAFCNFESPSDLFEKSLSFYPPDMDRDILKSSLGDRAFFILSESEGCADFRRKALVLGSPEMANASPRVLYEFKKGLNELKMPEHPEAMSVDLRLHYMQSLAYACFPFLDVYDKTHDSHPGGTTPEIDQLLTELVITFANYAIASLEGYQKMGNLERIRHLEQETFNLFQLARVCSWNLQNKQHCLQLADSTIEFVHSLDPDDRRLLWAQLQDLRCEFGHQATLTYIDGSHTSISPHHPAWSERHDAYQSMPQTQHQTPRMLTATRNGLDILNDPDLAVAGSQLNSTRTEITQPLATSRIPMSFATSQLGRLVAPDAHTIPHHSSTLPRAPQPQTHFHSEQ